MSSPASRRRSRPAWKPNRPYDALPLLPPAADLESKAILKACIAARAALGELKQAAELIPNQSILINTLPLLESQASSEIENIVTTSDRLFQFREADDHADPPTKEALRYSQALLDGFASLSKRPLSTRTTEQICSQIKGHTMRVRHTPGTALARGGTGEIVYTPPVGEDLLRSLLANWERFLHEATDLDPLIRLAVGHYQFEAIHPFTDGNGRTGRIINSLYLISEKLLTLPILYLSRYLIAHRSDYYQLLRAVTKTEAWEDWVLFILRGVDETARWTMGKIEAIRVVQAATGEHLRARARKVYSYELLNAIFELPYCRIHNLTDRGLASRQTASQHLRRLVDIGVLEERTAGREKLFVNTRLLQVLTHDANDFPPFPRSKARKKPAR